MSYVRAHEDSFIVSGSVSVSYPASEHGGRTTAHYSEQVVIRTNIHVDTDPLDRSVMRANQGIDILTGSVVAMEAAQVASIKESAKKISDRMIRGFYGLINMDLTTQRTESSTALKTKFGLLNQYAQAVKEMQNRMESDTARIRGHYGSVFRQIDEDLSTRIRDLDKETFELVDKARDSVILGPGKAFVPFCFEQNKQSGKVDGMITMARLRSKTASVISKISDYVLREEDYAENLQRVLDADGVKSAQVECIPVIVCRKDRGGALDTGFECFVPEMKGEDRIREKVGFFADSTKEESWKVPAKEDKEKLDEAFWSCLGADAEQKNSSGAARERVYSEIRRLWQEHKETMKTLC